MTLSKSRDFSFVSLISHPNSERSTAEQDIKVQLGTQEDWANLKKTRCRLFNFGATIFERARAPANPLALRHERYYTSCRSGRVKAVFRPIGTAPGDARSSDSESRRAPTAARLRHFRASSSNLKRGHSNPPRLALPGASSP